MNQNENKCPKCPVCGCTEYATIYVSDPGGYADLCINGIGCVYPLVCIECGVIYLDSYYTEMLREAK